MVIAAQDYEMKVVKMNLNLALRRLRDMEDETEDPAARRVLRQRIIELVNLIERL